MNKILLGALVCAAAATLVFYLVDPEKFTETVDDLKGKADDILSKAKDGLRRAEEDMGSATT